ncbi:glycosyltransferase [Hanstruepera flava]|uniref:glycosyltransferase n=1 Tax=Hanstruepera flava TaxID=2930218 RepID=UPI00202778C3|nr:glycosyltransferase [Hanstruepera flava]
MTIAIFTPSQNPYSETFIQAHKQYLQDRVCYYYGNLRHMRLEGETALVPKHKEWQYRLQRKIQKQSYSAINGQRILYSLKQQQVDVVLVEYGTHAHNLLSLLKQSGLPVVVHFHGYDASVHVVIEQCEQYKAVFAYAKYVVAVSQVMYQKLLALGCPKAKLVYNVYGPQPEFESVNPKFSKKQFIGIGRFTDKKAPYYTIMAFNKVAKQHPEAQLVLAGDGVLLDMCKNLVKHYQLENQVQFLGVITPERYRELLGESLAFVQHSVTATNGDMEGTPLAVLEASVSGLPVIATKHAGIPDVIKLGETGLLCYEHDVDGMAAHMKQLLDDVNFARQLGTNGKANILEQFSMKRHIQDLQDILEAAAKNSLL